MKTANKQNITQRVVGGKRVEIPSSKSIHLTNADFIRGSKYGLYELLKMKNKYVYKCIEYNNLFPETLSKDQIHTLTCLFNNLDEFLNENPLIDPTKHRITSALRKGVSSLRTDYRGLHEKLDKSNLPERLDIVCRELIEFVINFSETFFFIDGLIDDIRKIPNRTPDCELRVLVDKVITDYQMQRNTTKYPTYPYVMKELNSLEGYELEDDGLPPIELSVRQYGNFKKWRNRGTYWWYIQP